MTTSSNNPHRTGSRMTDTRGVTLAEVMVTAFIGAFILTAILTSFLFIGKSGANLYNYTGMEEEARKGLEKFGEDTRMASGIVTTTATWPYQVTLYIPDTTTNSAMTANKSQVKYYWDNTASSSTYHCFLRQDSSGTTTLIHNVNTFTFQRYQQGSSLPPATAANDSQTNQLQIQMVLQIQAGTAYATNASNLVVSARFILRNKPQLGNYLTPP